MSLQILFDRLHDAWKRCDWPNLQQCVRISPPPPPCTNKHIKNPHTHAPNKKSILFKIFHASRNSMRSKKGALSCKIPTTTLYIYIHIWVSIYPFSQGRVCVCVCNASCVNPELLRKTYGHNKWMFPFFAEVFSLLLLILRHKMDNGFVKVRISSIYLELRKHIFATLWHIHLKNTFVYAIRKGL